MPATAKGLPYPASTAPPNVPADLQALAADLDFSKVMLLTAAQVTAASALSAYPLGLSLLSLSTAEASGGGWPGAASCHVLTVKPTTNRAAQFVFRNASAPVASFYRQLLADPGPHSPWVSASAPYAQYIGSVTLNTATNPTAAVVITWPSGRFSVAPRVLLGSNSNLWFAAGTVTASQVSIVGRNITGTTGGTAPVISVHAVQATSASADTD